MTNQEVEDMLLDRGLNSFVFMTSPNYGEAIVGITNDGRLVYDFDLMIDHLIAEGICEDSFEAADFICYNASYMKGEDYPVILHRFEDY